MFKLFKKGIKRKYINREKIVDIILNRRYMMPIVIAEGIPPKNGLDARFDYKIDISKAGKPKELENGKIDYRELDNVIMVKKDDVILEKIPPTEGEPGEDVYGNIIPPVPGKDKPLPAGKNTYITEDGLKLCAKIDGFIYISDLGVNVGDTFLVNSSLNYQIGNIHYAGDVYIKENVLNGFIIESDNGNIAIDGEVEGATIIAKKGDIEIKKGAFSKSKLIAPNGKIVCSILQGGVEVEAKEVVNLDKKGLSKKDYKKEYESLSALKEKNLESVKKEYSDLKSRLKILVRGSTIHERDYRTIYYRYEGAFVFSSGVHALLEMLKSLDIKEEIQNIIRQIKQSKGKKREDLFKKLKIFVSFYASGVKPESTILENLPVIPADLRPIVQLD